MTPCPHRTDVDGDRCRCHSDRFLASDPVRGVWRSVSQVCEHPCPFRDRPNRRTGPGWLLHRLLGRLGVHRPAKSCGCAHRAITVDRWWRRMLGR